MECNLEGDDVDRTALVFLPPSYAARKNQRYPVVYALHGYSIGAVLSGSKSSRICQPSNEAALEAAKTPADSAKLPFGLRAQLASAAAWSPNPKNPPMYLDLPTKDGLVQQDVNAKWTANSPLAFVDQYVCKLREYRAIFMDVGDQDGLRTGAEKLHEALHSYSIPNSFEIYHGTHTSAVADRFQNHVLPFFSRTPASAKIASE